MKQALNSGQVSVLMFRSLAYGRTTNRLSGSDLSDLLLLIAEQTEGFDVALEILHMRLLSDRLAQSPHESELLEVGRNLLRSVRFHRYGDRDIYNLTELVRICLAEPKAAEVAAELADRLKRAVATGETYSFDNNELLKTLLTIQPSVVLDAIFDGDNEEQQEGIDLFDNLSGSLQNPADQISSEELVAWCNQDPEKRFVLAAAFVTLGRRSEESGLQVWSEHAMALLTNAPDPCSVLAVFVDRFRPSSWSGSRATLMEANVRMLDSLEGGGTGRLTMVVAEARIQLVREIEKERIRETTRDRVRDERFE